MNIKTFLFCLLVIISSCAKEQVINDISQRNKELLVYLRDSTDILIESNDLEVSGQFEGDSVEVRYFSVSPEEFYKAFEESEDYIRLFLRNGRFNEVLGHDVYRYKETDLIIEIDGKKFTFSDNESEKTWYFYEGMLGDTHLISGFRFEDILTIYLNSKTGSLKKEYNHGTLTTNKNERLVFFSEFPLPSFLKDSTEVNFFRINSDKVDTLASTRTKWLAEIAFFKTPRELYYIHSIFDRNLALQSSYAKMEIYLK